MLEDVEGGAGLAFGWGEGEPGEEAGEDLVGDEHEVAVHDLLDRAEAEFVQFVGVGHVTGDGDGGGDEEAGVEADGGVRGGYGAAEVVELVEAWGGTEGETGFLLQFAGGGGDDGAGEAGLGAALEDCGEGWVGLGGGLGVGVGGVDGATGEDEAVGEEAVAGSADAHEDFGAAGFADDDEACGVTGEDGTGGDGAGVDGAGGGDVWACGWVRGCGFFGGLCHGCASERRPGR